MTHKIISSNFHVFFYIQTNNWGNLWSFSKVLAPWLICQHPYKNLTTSRQHPGGPGHFQTPLNDQNVLKWHDMPNSPCSCSLLQCVVLHIHTIMNGKKSHQCNHLFMLSFKSKHKLIQNTNPTMTRIIVGVVVMNGFHDMLNDYLNDYLTKCKMTLKFKHT